MKSDRSYIYPFLMTVFLAIGLYIGTLLSGSSGVSEELSTGSERYQKIQDIIHILDRRYVDSIDSEDIFERAISDMLHNLDPHSNYIPARDMKAMNEEIQGKFGGIGIRFFIIRDTVCVTHVIPESPSDQAGVLAGDKIVRVDGKVLKKGISNEEIMAKLKGHEGTSVKLGIKRRGKSLELSLTRGIIPVESVTAAFMLDSKTGFIKIERFSVETAVEFRAAANKLLKKGMVKLIVDLRNNGGGVLTTAVEIADEFLRSGLVIVETRGLHSGKESYRSTANGMLHDIKLAVLINSHSASASEILAGAIQDNDRGMVIGRRSFGKGLVQEDVTLRDGSNLRLTVARYYTPTGRCIQKSYSEGVDSYYEDELQRYESGEVYELDSSLFVDSLKYFTPKGKVVYGGGGIMPDVFVPLDSTGSSWYLSQLSYTPVFTSFAFDYVENKRNKWKSAREFAAGFTVDDQLLNTFASYAEREFDVKINQAGIRQSKKILVQRIKGEIARQLWVEQGYFESLFREDDDIKEALKSF